MNNLLKQFVMMKSGLRRPPRGYLIGLVLLLAVACSQGSYPLDFFYEMHYQQSYKSHEPPRLSPPVGAVAQCSSENTEPWCPPPAPRTAGEHLFQVNCSMCHGSTGKGDGPVLKKMIDQYGYQPAITPDLTSPQVKFLPDPAIEAFMVSGVVVMPSFAKLLSPEERRLIIEYVRTLQR